MAWGKNDFIAAALISVIIAVAVISGIILSGAVNPSIDAVFPFGK